MQASRVTVDKKLTRSDLKPSDRTRLRIKLFKELVQSKPAGTPISNKEICDALGYKSSSAPVSFIRKLENRGIIAVDRSEWTNSYAINDAKTVKTIKNREPVSDLSKVEPITATPQKPLSAESQAIRTVVLEYFWHEQSDSLRKFVSWLEGGGLDTQK